MPEDAAKAIEEVRCLAILSEIVQKARPNNLMGKLKLQECNKEMVKISEFRYKCPDGHQRIWPLENWEEKQFEKNYTLPLAKIKGSLKVGVL